MRNLLIVFALSLSFACCGQGKRDGIAIADYPKADNWVYELTNLADEPYYTWLDLNNSFEGDDCVRSIRRYLSVFHGDFNLIMLLTEDLVFSSEFTPELGATFIKKIEPGLKFKYIMKENSSIVERHIFYVSESDLFREYVGGIVNTCVLYGGEDIMISNSIIERLKTASVRAVTFTERRCPL